MQEPEKSDRNKKISYVINNKKYIEYIYDFTKTIIFVFAIITILFTFVIRDANVVGSSMSDTLHNDDKVLLTNFMYEPKTGDIVVINTENLAEKRIIKRVIATAGQTLTINYSTGEVCVDGIILDENYISSFTKKPTNDFSIPYVIPEGYIFVMGDNRNVSLDSRDAELGLISVDEVIGKAQFIFFPLDRVTYLY